MKCAVCGKEVNGFFCARELSYNEDGTGEMLVTAFEATTVDGRELCEMCIHQALRRLLQEERKEVAGEDNV